VNPLPVSVVIPAYNVAASLPRALSSVVRQSPRAPEEIIVVDDGSTDDLTSLAREWGAVLYRHSTNRGAAVARNTGIAAATHEWVALLDGDDEWLPDHLATLFSLRQDHNIVAAAVLKLGSGSPRYDGYPGTNPRVIRRAEDLLFPACFIRPSATLLRKSAVLAAGGYDPTLRLAQDLDLLVRMLAHGSAVCSPEVTALWHHRSGQASEDRHGMRRAHLAIARRHARPDRRVRLTRSCEAVALWDDLRSSDPPALRVRAATALLADPRHLVALLTLWKWRRRGRQASTTSASRAAVTEVSTRVEPDSR
jgi:glycosyltransferase involved in cell wall biosynthesis